MHSMRICSKYGITVKFGISTTLVVLEMVNFTRPISNTTLVVFIPNFTATHAITTEYKFLMYIIYSNYLSIYGNLLTFTQKILKSLIGPFSYAPSHIFQKSVHRHLRYSVK